MTLTHEASQLSFGRTPACPLASHAGEMCPLPRAGELRGCARGRRPVDLAPGPRREAKSDGSRARGKRSSTVVQCLHEPLTWMTLRSPHRPSAAPATFIWRLAAHV